VNWLDGPDPENNKMLTNLDQMFVEVFKKLEGGYLTTFYYDCAYLALIPD
jgi:hypothetical protein